MSIQTEVETILLAEIPGDLRKGSLDPNEDLLGQGLIDSLGLMKLITKLEAAFCVQIADEDIVPENFQTVKILTEFIERKKQG